MMDYEIFKNVITERIMDFLPPIYGSMVPTIEEVTKVNEVKEALVLKPGEEGLAMAMPMVYLDDMYELFAVEEDMDNMLRFIANVFMSFTGSISKEEFEVDFKDKLDSIFLCLINKERNHRLLQTLPHVDVLDMALIYRIIMRETADGLDMVLVTEDVLKELDMTRQELHELAVENTRRLFPPRIIEMCDHYCMVSNDRNMFGATAMIFEDTMKEAAEQVGSDTFYIIPCSIHEFIAVAEEEADVEDLIKMLAAGNMEVTLPKEILSNCIYRYDAAKETLKKIAGYCEQEIKNQRS